MGVCSGLTGYVQGLKEASAGLELFMEMRGAPFLSPEPKKRGLDPFSPSFDVVKKRALGLHRKGKQRDLENKRELGQPGA